MSGDTLSFFIDWFPNKPVELEQGKTYRIGRGGGNEFYLPDVHASRVHAEIKWNGRAFDVADLNSSNGTFCNGSLLEGRRELQDGDEVQVGTHVLRLRAEQAGTVEEEYQKTQKEVQEWQTVVGYRPPDGQGLSGRVEDMGLPQVVQMLEGGRKTGRLLITSTGCSGSIYFRDGRVVSADFITADAPDTPTEGHDAFFSLLDLPEGVFEFMSEDVDLDPLIVESTQALLIEGMRRKDEKLR